jgi:hypothetical protein
MKNMVVLAEIVKGMVAEKPTAKKMEGVSVGFTVWLDDQPVNLDLSHNTDLFYPWILCEMGKGGVVKCGAFGTMPEVMEAIASIANGEDVLTAV